MYIFALWRFRPRRPYYLWWRYVRWRVETYTAIPSHDVTWRVMLQLLRQKKMRSAFINYIKWVYNMEKKYR